MTARYLMNGQLTYLARSGFEVGLVVGPGRELEEVRKVRYARDETLDDTELVEGMIDFFRRDGPASPPGVFVRQCDACLGHDVLERLPELSAPTLVVCGEHDQLTPVRLHRELTEHLPDGRLVVLPHAGHLVEVETADRFNSVVDQFLDEGK